VFPNSFEVLSLLRMKRGKLFYIKGRIKKPKKTDFSHFGHGTSSMPRALTTYRTRFLWGKHYLGNVFSVISNLFVCVIWIAHVSTRKLFSFDDITGSIQQDKRTEEGNFYRTPTSITIRGWFSFSRFGLIDCVSVDLHPSDPCKLPKS
jgi:hypothetical protein